MSELVRVLRLVEYVGPREWVEESVQRAIHGTKTLPNGGRITAVTLQEYPEILNSDEARREDDRSTAALTFKKLKPRSGFEGIFDGLGDPSTVSQGQSKRANHE